MKSYKEVIVNFTEFVKRVYDQHLPTQFGSIASMGDYIKSLKQQLELIEGEVAMEKQRLLSEAALNPAIDIDTLGDEFFNIVERQHNAWMKTHKPQ